MRDYLTNIINNNEENKFGIIKNYENKINNLFYQIDCLKQENFNIKQQFHINENNHLENTNLIYEESQKINKKKKLKKIKSTKKKTLKKCQPKCFQTQNHHQQKCLLQ